MTRISLFAFGLVLATTTVADTTLTFTKRHQHTEPTSSILTIKDQRIGISDEEDPGRISVVFDQSRSAFTFINHRQQQYTVVSEAWMRDATERTKAAMKRMEAQMQQQMDNIPPQYRSMMQQGRMMMPMMSGTGAPAAAKTYLPYGNESVGEYSCRRVDVTEGGKKTQELCIASASGLGMDQADFGTVLAMQRVADILARQGAFSLGFQPPLLSQGGGLVQGIPIKLVDLKTNATIQLLKTDSGEVGRETLQPPADYLEAKIPLPAP